MTGSDAARPAAADTHPDTPADAGAATPSAAPAGAVTDESRRAAPARVYAPDFLIDLFRNPLDPGYADAAARRRADGPATGWHRTTPRVLSTVVLLLVGVLFAVAYREAVAAEPGRGQARAGLVRQINERQDETQRLAQRAEELRDEVNRQRDAALPSREVARLREWEAAAGLARVAGDGLVVRLADAPTEPDVVTGRDGPDLGRVLDTDLQDVANALWASGAEAIAINGQRLTATSTIRAAGGAIVVDYWPVNGPYEVAAIGPDEMLDRFEASRAANLMRSVSADHGLAFDVRRADDLTLPAAGEPQLRAASPSPSTPPGAVTSGPAGSVTSGPPGSVTSGPAGAGPSPSSPRGTR